MEPWAQPLLWLKSLGTSGVHNLAESGQVILPVFIKCLLIMLGGGLGALSRYGIGLLSVRLWGGPFSLGHAGRQPDRLLSHRTDLCRRRPGPAPEPGLAPLSGNRVSGRFDHLFHFRPGNGQRRPSRLDLQPLANILVNNIGGLALVFIGMRIGGLR